MKLGLRTRMVLLALLPSTLVAMAMAAVFLWHEIDNLEQGLRTRGTAVARNLAGLAEFGVFAGQRDVLGALSKSAVALDPDARGAAIVTPAGEIVAQGGELRPAHWPALGRIAGARSASGTLLFIEPVMARRLPVDDIYGGAGKRDEAPRVVGYAVLEMSLLQLETGTVRIVTVSLLFALMGAIFGAWLAWRIGRDLARPLLAAVQTVERIGQGNLSARMITEATGPLQSLANGINDMAARIGVTQDELRRRVADATAGLQREKEAAELATQAKSRFLAAASHDLRQPLHALGLFVNSLADSKAAKLEPGLVAHIRSATDTLQHLFDAILDVSRLDSGKVVPRLASFPLSHVFSSIQRDLSLIADKQNLRLRVRRTPLWVRSDEELVLRIVLNLVGNALRYTRSGGVLVAARRRGGDVQIEVWDTGDGIPEDAQHEIFEEYRQLGNPERDQSKGLGLGLSICRRLAGLLDAPIGLRSRRGWGSVFWIRLPRAGAHADLPLADAGSADVGNETPRIGGTVALVTDDPALRSSLETAVAGWGGAVLPATSGMEIEARCKALGVAPVMAICSLELPGTEAGMDVATRLASRYPGIGVLLVGDEFGEVTQAGARAAGYMLLKTPIAPGRLRAALHTVIANGDSARGASEMRGQQAGDTQE